MSKIFHLMSHLVLQTLSALSEENDHSPPFDISKIFVKSQTLVQQYRFSPISTSYSLKSIGTAPTMFSLPYDIYL